MLETLSMMSGSLQKCCLGQERQVVRGIHVGFLPCLTSEEVAVQSNHKVDAQDVRPCAFAEKTKA
jgi:hypothetical protein